MSATRRLLLLAALFTPSVLMAQTLTLAEGAPGSLRIVALDENDPNGGDSVVLQDAEFVPIEMTGRTIAHELDATRARRIERNGIVRLELPNGGRVFRYRRAAGAFWGFLHVAGDGTPRVVLERAGVGPLAVDDPFADRIAIADDGQHAAVVRADGAMHVVRLDGGLYTNGRADWVVGGVDVLPLSVMLGPACVWFQGESGSSNPVHVWRCDLTENSPAVDVSPPIAGGADFKDQMVMSRDGSVVVFLFGPQQQQRLWRVGTFGAATVLPPGPSKYEEPGYLPEEPGEPAMLLNDDGSRLFYVDADVRDELYLLDMTGQNPSLAMTEDAVFQPYIGVHILPKFAGSSLLIAIGDPGQMDWFRASLAPAGGTVTNLTGTGSFVSPFPAGTIDPVQAASVGTRLLAVEQQAAGLTLRQIDASTGAQAPLPQGVLGVPKAGSATAGAADLLVQTVDGDSVFAGADGSLLFTLPPELLLTPPVRGPQFSGTWLHLSIQFGIPVFYAPQGIVSLPLEFGLEQIVMTAAGGAVLVGSTLRYLALGRFETLVRPAATFRSVLSGAGG